VPDSPVREFLAVPSSRRYNSKQLYFGRMGYAAQPKSDKRDEFFVRAEVPESGLAIHALHLSNAAVSDYFYRLGQKSVEPTLYDILGVTRTASPADLRLSYRLRRIEYLNEYALYRYSRRKAEVYIDRALLPIGWDPTWNQWRHLIGTKIGIAGTFVESGKYRRSKEEWRLVQWQTALPSRLSLDLPANTEDALSSARRTYVAWASTTMR
jgi:hypothetical protein